MRSLQHVQFMSPRISTFGALIIGACLALPQIALSATTRDMEASKGWVREAGSLAPATAGYLVIVNKGGTFDALVSATTPVAASIEIHTTTIRDGVARMRRLDRLPLPPRKTTRLAPGSHHLMLIGLRRPLIAGDTVPITLNLASGRTIAARLRVGSQAAQSHTGQHHHEKD